jgi:hypothetical protein
MDVSEKIIPGTASSNPGQKICVPKSGTRCLMSVSR